MRLVNRVLVFALELAVAALGFVVAVEAAWTGLGYRFLWFPGRQWLHTLRSTAWSTRSVLVGGTVAAVVGLVLLVAEIRPRPKRLAQMSVEGDSIWLLHRRSTERHLGRMAHQRVPSAPITTKLQVSPRRWRLLLKAQGGEEVRTTLESVGGEELDKLLAPSGSLVSVKVAEGRDR